VNLAYPAGQVGPAGNIAFNGFPGAGVALKPSTTYYFNINNRNNGVPTCGGSHCPISVTLKTN
jgi:hypothetical protein